MTLPPLSFPLASALRRFCPILVLTALVCVASLSHAANTQELAQLVPRAIEGEFAGKRPFKGMVRREQAMRAAFTAAELAAYEYAARLLSQEPDLQFLSRPLTENASASPHYYSLDGLARIVFRLEVAARGVEGFPPNVLAVIYLRPVSPRALRDAVQKALIRPDRMEMYGYISARQRLLLQRYDGLSAALLPLTPMLDPLRDDGGGAREDMVILQSIISELSALEQFEGLLTEYGESWPDPQKAKDRLSAILPLAPNNPLVLTSLAEAHLQLDRPVLAMDFVSKALVQAPDFAKAHDVKGTVFLRQRLPALAAQSYSKAIELAPWNTSYRVHRASAYLVQEELAAMCSDFSTACTLGDCEGLRWATDTGKCRLGAVQR